MMRTQKPVDIISKRKTVLMLMRLSYVVLAAAFVRCMVLRMVWDPLVLGLLGIFLVLAIWSVSISVRYWKCPHCGHWLELKKGSADQTGICPKCGQKL